MTRKLLFINFCVASVVVWFGFGWLGMNPDIASMVSAATAVGIGLLLHWLFNKDAA